MRPRRLCCCTPHGPSFVRSGRGGPIIRNHLFGFFSYETLDNNGQSTPGSGWYETDAFRALAASGTNASAFLSYPGVAPFGGAQVDEDCSFIGLTEGVNCHFIPGQGLGPVRVDPVQIDQILMNLGTNAWHVASAEAL